MPVSLRHDTQHLVDRQRKLVAAPKPVETPVIDRRRIYTIGSRVGSVMTFWSEEDVKELRRLARLGRYRDEIGRELNRSSDAVGRKAVAENITIRRRPRVDRASRVKTTTPEYEAYKKSFE